MTDDENGHMDMQKIYFFFYTTVIRRIRGHCLYSMVPFIFPENQRNVVDHRISALIGSALPTCTLDCAGFDFYYSS